MKIQWHTEMTVTKERINQQKHTVGWQRDTGSNMADRGGDKVYYRDRAEADRVEKILTEKYRVDNRLTEADRVEKSQTVADRVEYRLTTYTGRHSKIYVSRQTESITN